MITIVTLVVIGVLVRHLPSNLRNSIASSILIRLLIIRL